MCTLTYKSKVPPNLHDIGDLHPAGMLSTHVFENIICPHMSLMLFKCACELAPIDLDSHVPNLL